MHTVLLAKAVEAEIARDAATPRLRDRFAARRPARRRRRARSVELVPAPVRIQRPAGW